MASTDTPTSIVNEALQLVGDNQPPVTGTAPDFDDSTAGKAAALLYGPTVEAVGRQFGFDFARKTVQLEVTGTAAPYPWAYEYKYPPNGVQVWQLLPRAEDDVNNPKPWNFVVANGTVDGAQVRVIHSNLDDAFAVYNNNPLPSAWDSLFHQAVVRLLASGLNLAIAGKPDTAKLMIQSGAAFEAAAEQRGD